MHSIRKLCADNWTYVWISISLITYIPATTQIRNKSDNISFDVPSNAQNGTQI